MSGDKKGKAKRGSQLWLQKFVNEQPKALNKAIIDVAPALAGQTIEWVSPLASQHYAEYKDQAFLDKLGIQLTKKPLESFWPERGPVWDRRLSMNRRGAAWFRDAPTNACGIARF